MNLNKNLRMKSFNTAKCVGLDSNTPNRFAKSTAGKSIYWLFFTAFFILPSIINAQTNCCGSGKGDKVKQLTLWYTGENCNASSNNQGAKGSKWDCTGDAAFDAQVYIIVNNSTTASTSGAYFAGNVNLDGTFVATAATEMGADSYVHIFNQQGGTRIQFIKIHTSCSVPVVLGDQFGSIILVDAKFKNGYSCTPPDPCLLFTPTITGTGGLCVDNLSPTTLTASGGGTYKWNTGATTASINFTPTQTTTYTVTVTSPSGCTKSVSKTVNVIDCTGEICFSGSNGVGATANWIITYTQDPANDRVKIRATLSKNFVDNTYGTNAIGWPSGHTFGNLTGSDYLRLAILDKKNIKKLDFEMDYLTSDSRRPSGFGSLGVSGGDGSMILGNPSDIVKVTTSLDENFNTFGYVLTTNSPATNSSYAPNAQYPNWIYDVWYEVEIKLSALGADGFGKVGISDVHASPSKVGSNTVVVTEGPCPDPCDVFKPSITGTNTICNDNLVPTELRVTGGIGTYKWSTGATTSSIMVTPSVTSTYTVTVTSVDNCVKVLTKTIQVKPCSGQICFNGANGVGATANWTITYTEDPANDKVKIRATLSKNFVDNTYGTGAIGWPNGQQFSKLVSSDHLVLSMLDGNNVKRIETKLDYISASNTAPSGYDALGVTGGEGQMFLGNSSDVLSSTTSLDQNLNSNGPTYYGVIVNSPATNSNYTPNPTYPNWIYDVWYEVEVRLSAFGAAGFGKVGITGVHASPSKTGNNTEEVEEGPCCEIETRIVGDSLLCPGETTTLSVITSKSLVINATEDVE
ncbi:MAG: hypothetical protein RIR48_1160, partial [Bacteroidota bacterium]